MSTRNDKARPVQTNVCIQWGMPKIIIPWHNIRLIIILTHIFNGFAVIFSLGLMLAAINTKTNIGDFLNMVTDGDGTQLPIVLGVSGTLCAPLNITMIVFIWKMTGSNTSRLVNTVLFTLVLISCCMILVLLSLAVFALSHSYSIHHRLHDGITEAMINYKSDSRVKIRLDILQISFHCCGSRKYKEWFEIPWFDSNNTTNTQNQVTRDDTPFSCCSMRTPYPCIHHDVMSVGSSFLYAPETNLSVSEHGCHTVLLRHTKNVAWKTALALFCFSILQGALCIATRFLQTSHMEKYRFEKNHWYTAWLFGFYKRKSSNRTSDSRPRRRH